MLWLEPLVEVATPEGRIGYGPVTAADVDGLVDAGCSTAADHPSRLGVVDDLPWLARQHRVTFARVGVIDPLSPDDYEAHGGLAGLRRALDDVAGRASSRRSPTPGCAAAAAPASRPASSGRPCSTAPTS